MAISKVNYGSNVLMDLTGDTVDAEHLAEGYTAHDKTGAPIIGTMVSGSGASGEEYSVRWSGKLSSCNGMFADNKNISSLDVSNFDTSQVTDTSNMFSFCQALTNFTSCVFRTSVSFNNSNNVSFIKNSHPFYISNKIIYNYLVHYIIRK